MFKDKTTKTMAYILGVVLVVLAVGGYQYSKEVREENRQFDYFLNHLYSSVDSSIGRIDYMLKEKPEDEDLVAAVRLLDEDLLKANTVLHSARTFINMEIYNTYFFLDATNFLYGITSSGEFTFKLPPISEDGHLGEKEIAILETLRDYMNGTKEAMYSDETMQEDPELTVNKMNEILETHLTQDKVGIYRESLK
ncbi:hypothetical protein [Halobacillus sp. BBL2006]|uniref:hypothetical protein n=1 Tax=Halobacillus sp. BBL2006 TaxID=1543706 RepID=UPI000542ED18|nr:hypothetical protein [Halobacillus sp. BBL2006]KHE73203.1 hypothetical protein LD39_00585 [Halobacillus sp. BBL2006]